MCAGETRWPGSWFLPRGLLYFRWIWITPHTLFLTKTPLNTAPREEVNWHKWYRCICSMTLSFFMSQWRDGCDSGLEWVQSHGVTWERVVTPAAQEGTTVAGRVRGAGETCRSTSAWVTLRYVKIMNYSLLNTSIFCLSALGFLVQCLSGKTVFQGWQIQL